MPTLLRKAFKGIGIVAAMIGGLVVYGLLTGDVSNALPEDSAVIAHLGKGFYATVGCLFDGRVSVRYVTNPEDLIDPNKRIYKEPFVVTTTLHAARNLTSVNSERLRPDPACNGFRSEATPIWRWLIGW